MKRALLTVLCLLLILTSAACGSQPVQPDETSVPSVSPAASPALSDEPAHTQAPLDEPVKVAWTCSTEEAPWQQLAAIEIKSGASGREDITIVTSLLKQEIEGFGGAFNEKGWEALSVLKAEERAEVIKAMFDPVEGAKFNICRVPIGASDYAVSRYTLNETKGDLEMKEFSIERDREYLLPYIKAAMECRPDLKIWGSVWTPPTWMKKSGDFDGGYMKDDAEIYEAYALYLARFVEEYRAEGIDLFAVAVQNEPEIDRNYPTCLWTKEQYATFIKNHMGPLFEKRNVEAEIMLGTFQDGDFNLYPKLLFDQDVNKYVSIVGFQWEGIRSVANTRKIFSDKLIYQTETECGNWFWKDDFDYDPERPQNDWAYGVYTWNKVKEYFDEGVNAYMLWNMVLDEEGKSIDSKKPWPQNAAITVNKETGEVTYTPMFWAFRHFSYYVEPGAHCVEMRSDENAIAFINPDGSLIIELQNQEEGEKVLTINIDGDVVTAALPGMSWSTLVVPAR